MQQVRWDKIPSYCKECKHVGHKSEMCYAAGKEVRPVKRNYNTTTPTQPHHESHGEKGNQGQSKHTPNVNEWQRQGKSKEVVGHAPSVPMEKEGEAKGWSGPDIMGELHHDKGEQSGSQMEHGNRFRRGGNGHPNGSAFGPLHGGLGSLGAERKRPTEHREALGIGRGGLHGSSGRHSSSRGRGG